jgi:hypothetical protein
MNYPRLGAACAMAFLALIPGAAWPESYQGGVRGVIQDPGGAVIAGANVALQNQVSNAARTVLRMHRVNTFSSHWSRHVTTSKWKQPVQAVRAQRRGRGYAGVPQAGPHVGTSSRRSITFA